MSDLINRADAIEAVEQAIFNHDSAIMRITALPSAETHEIRTETHGVCLISKDDAMGAVQDHFNANGFKGYDDGQKMMDRIKALPSADAVPQMEHDREWIIGCIKHDGFIKTDRFDKANQIILDALSADAVQGEWIIIKEGEYDGRSVYKTVCSECGHETFYKANKAHFCPNCGARMKGGAE